MCAFANGVEVARQAHYPQRTGYGKLTLVDDLCRVMGRTLYNLVVTLDLQRISMGGSVFWHHRDFLLPRLFRHITGRLGALTQGFDLVAAGIGEQVGDYAALALVR